MLKVKSGQLNDNVQVTVQIHSYNKGTSVNYDCAYLTQLSIMHDVMYVAIMSVFQNLWCNPLQYIDCYYCVHV